MFSNSHFGYNLKNYFIRPSMMKTFICLLPYSVVLHQEKNNIVILTHAIYL